MGEVDAIRLALDNIKAGQPVTNTQQLKDLKAKLQTELVTMKSEFRAKADQVQATADQITQLLGETETVPKAGSKSETKIVMPVFVGFVIGFVCFTAVLSKLAGTMFSSGSRKHGD